MKISVFIYAFLLLIFCGSDLNACSTFFLRTMNKMLVGHNLDWHTGNGLIVVNKRNVTKKGKDWSSSPKWTSKYGSITVNQDGREFPSRGINEKGLVIAGMTLEVTEYPIPDNRSPLNDSQWLQYMLDNCATVDEVIAYNDSVRIDRNQYPGHYMVCDSKGNCACLEWLDGKLVVFKGDNMPVKLMVNEKYSTCQQDGDDYTKRFATGKKLLEQYNDSTSGNPVNYAFKVVDTLKYWNIYGTLHSELNVWQLVWDISEGRCYIRTYKNFNVRYLDLKDVSFSCSDPVMMLDINSNDTGNLASKLKPYTYIENRNSIAKTYKDLEAIGIGPFSNQQIEETAKYPEYKTSCNANDIGFLNTENTKPIKIEYHKDDALIEILFRDKLEKNAVISLYNINGQIIQSAKSSRQTLRIKTNTIEPGIYLCSVVTEREAYSSKFIVY